MNLTPLERGAIYWAKEIIKKEIEEDEIFYKNNNFKNNELKEINKIILKKKKDHFNALVNLLEREKV